MLKSIGIENFKAFGQYSEFELNQLSLIAGLNGSGKSSIYQALLLLIQSNNENLLNEKNCLLSCLLLNGEYFNFGTNNEILNDTKKEYINIFLSFKNDVSVKYKFILQNIFQKKIFVLSEITFKKGQESSYHLKLNENGNWDIEATAIIRFIEYKLDGILFDYLLKKSKHKGKPFSPFANIVRFNDIELINISNQSLNSFSVPFEEIVNCIDPKYRDLVDIEFLKKEFKRNKIKTDRLWMANAEYPILGRSLFSEQDIAYIPPFRGSPRRVYYEGNYKSPIDPNKFHNESAISYYYDLQAKKSHRGSIQDAIKFWISNIFKIAEDIQIETSIEGLLSEIYVAIDGKKIPINNVGFGISQVLPVIFNLLISDENQLIIIDEPEIHLHPSLQSKLADFFFNMALLGRCILIETHSEYLIDKLIYLSIKYEKFDEIKTMLWVENVNGSASFKKIEYDELGYLINPPENFLNEKKKLVDDLNTIRMQKMDM